MYEQAIRSTEGRFDGINTVSEMYRLYIWVFAIINNEDDYCSQDLGDVKCSRLDSSVSRTDLSAQD